MNLTTLVVMGTTAVGGVIIEKVLGKLGKIEEAGMVSMVTTSILACTVVVAAINVFKAVRTLGN